MDLLCATVTVQCGSFHSTLPWHGYFLRNSCSFTVNQKQNLARFTMSCLAFAELSISHARCGWLGEAHAAAGQGRVLGHGSPGLAVLQSLGSFLAFAIGCFGSDRFCSSPLTLSQENPRCALLFLPLLLTLCR